MDPEQLAAAVAVADESLAAQTADYGLQAAIAQHRPDLWAALASNPTTYPGLLEWLSGIQEPAVRLALEARGIAPQTEAVPQAGEGVPGDARPEGPVEPPAGEAEAAEPPDSPSGEAEPEADASDEPAESPADEAAPEEADSEVAADASAGDSAPEGEPVEPPAEEPADSRADGDAPTETIETGTDEAEPEADASDEPADSPADENEPEEAVPGPEVAAESPDSPSDEAEPAESPADEAAPEETDSEVAADAPADEDEPADSLSAEVEPEEDAPGPEVAVDASAGDSAPEGEPVEPPAEEASAGADEAEPEADEDVSEADASDEPAESPSDEDESADSLADEADSEVAVDASAGDGAPEGEPVEPLADEASAGADEDVSEADASDESADAPADEVEPVDAPSDVAEPVESLADEAEPEAAAESLAGEVASAGVSPGEVPAPPPETPASTPGTALSAGFASQPAVAPGSFFVPTQAQAAGSLGSAPSPSRTRKPVIIVVILALLLAGGAGGWFLMSVIYDTPITLSLPGQGHKAHRGGGKAAGDSTASDSTPGSVDPTGTGATNYVTPCGSAPTFTPASVKNGDGELKVEVKVTASCPSGDVLGGTANHIELKGPSRSDGTGSADAVVASGDFDFSDSPLVIPDSGTTLTLRFGEGHFFRTADDLDVKTITVACTPDRASGTSGATAGVPSASGSSNPSSASASTTSQDSASEESAAESSLKWQVDHDRPSVTKDLTGKWVAQLSSKKPGMTADGMTWDNRTTLQEFLKLRQKYPSAKLLYSENWPVFDAGGEYWVTIAGTPYSTAAEANAWCDAQGFDAEHCFAKYIDTKGPSEGTTVNR